MALILPKEFQCDSYGRQTVCGVGFRQMIDNFEDVGDFVAVKDCRLFDPKTDECTEAVLKALMYSFIFGMKDRIALVGSSAIIIDERTLQNRRPEILPSLMEKPSQRIITQSFNDIKKGVIKLSEEYDEFSYSERVDLISDLMAAMKAEGLEMEQDEEYGVCCFCEGPCNPLSQSCGRCARKLYW